MSYGVRLRSSPLRLDKTAQAGGLSVELLSSAGTRWRGFFDPLLLFKKQRSFLLDQGLNFRSDRREKPRQNDLKPNMILKDVNCPCNALGKRTQTELQAVSGPHFFLHGNQLPELSPCGLKAGLQARRGYYLAEAMRDRDDEWLRHVPERYLIERVKYS
jgi:hypothetical protein